MLSFHRLTRLTFHPPSHTSSTTIDFATSLLSSTRSAGIMWTVNIIYLSGAKQQEFELFFFSFFSQHLFTHTWTRLCNMPRNPFRLQSRLTTYDSSVQKRERVKYDDGKGFKVQQKKENFLRFRSHWVFFNWNSWLLAGQMSSWKYDEDINSFKSQFQSQLSRQLKNIASIG